MLDFDSVLKQYDAFRRGFQRVCDSKPFTFFRADELELLICGSPKLDFHELEDSTRYEGFESTSQFLNVSRRRGGPSRLTVIVAPRVK